VGERVGGVGEQERQGETGRDRKRQEETWREHVIKLPHKLLVELVEHLGLTSERCCVRIRTQHFSDYFITPESMTSDSFGDGGFCGGVR
jgi:hypothetical protein